MQEKAIIMKLPVASFSKVHCVLLVYVFSFLQTVRSYATAPNLHRAALCRNEDNNYGHNNGLHFRSWTELCSDSFLGRFLWYLFLPRKEHLPESYKAQGKPVSRNRTKFNKEVQINIRVVSRNRTMLKYEVLTYIRVISRNRIMFAQTNIRVLSRNRIMFKCEVQTNIRVVSRNRIMFKREVQTSIRVVSRNRTMFKYEVQTNIHANIFGPK